MNQNLIIQFFMKIIHLDRQLKNFKHSDCMIFFKYIKVKSDMTVKNVILEEFALYYFDDLLQSQFIKNDS